MPECLGCGGWCPEGRLAEDGTIPQEYPVKELPHGDYKDRTKQNVLDSDGTIIYFGMPTAGTELSIGYCINEYKPYCLIDAELASNDQSILKIKAFMNDKAVINVAGPRANGEPKAYDYTKEVLFRILSNK